MNGSSIIHQVGKLTHCASFCPTFDFFLLLLRQLLEKSPQVSEGLKAGGLRSCASAEFHKIIGPHKHSVIYSYMTGRDDVT